MQRVLFIGNSHTYFNDMPFLFQSMTQSEQAKADGVPGALATMIVHGGRLLCEHIKEPEVQYNIRYGAYDYVVVQQAAHPFPGKEALLSDGKTLAGWIHDAGAQMVGYMTWAEKAHPEHQAIMTDSYAALCAQTGSILAPVGAVWERILQEQHAPVELFYTDGEHASLAGSYLAACVLYAAIYGRSPVGLPHTFASRGKTIYELPKEQAQYLQQRAAAYLSV